MFRKRKLWFNINCITYNAKEPVFNIESTNTSCDEVVKLLCIDDFYLLYIIKF